MRNPRALSSGEGSHLFCSDGFERPVEELAWGKRIIRIPHLVRHHSYRLLGVVVLPDLLLLPEVLLPPCPYPSLRVVQVPTSLNMFIHTRNLMEERPIHPGKKPFPHTLEERPHSVMPDLILLPEVLDQGFRLHGVVRVSGEEVIVMVRRLSEAEVRLSEAEVRLSEVEVRLSSEAEIRLSSEAEVRLSETEVRVSPEAEVRVSEAEASGFTAWLGDLTTALTSIIQTAERNYLPAFGILSAASYSFTLICSSISDRTRCCRCCSFNFCNANLLIVDASRAIDRAPLAGAPLSTLDGSSVMPNIAAAFSWDENMSICAFLYEKSSFPDVSPNALFKKFFPRRFDRLINSSRGIGTT